MKTVDPRLERVLKNLLARIISCFPLRSLADPGYFRMWEDKGIHITADHCYSSIPNLLDIDRDIWEKEKELVGVDLNEQKQLELMKLFAELFSKEYARFPKTSHDVQQPYQYYLNNPFFGPGDAEILYGMIRNFKPRRIIEVGSGFSTYLSAQAIADNRESGSSLTELTAIECNPNDTLKKGFPGLTKLIQHRIEKVSYLEFESLQENDILFIDSSHTLKIGGDVQYLFLEILPRLNKGVLVHVHDIFFPGDYPRQWVLEDHRFWVEQYLLQAFLCFNNAYEVLWCGSFMHRRHLRELAGAFCSCSYQEDLSCLPKSFWMRRR